MLSHTLTAAGDVSGEPMSEDEYKRLHLVLGIDTDRMRDYRVIATKDRGGTSLTHVLGEYAQEVDRSRMLSPEDFARSAIMPPETLENYKRAFARMPDHARGTLDLWIDEATNLIRRLEWLDEGLRDGQIVHAYTGIRVYNEFNTAELPSPLPE